MNTGPLIAFARNATALACLGNPPEGPPGPSCQKSSFPSPLFLRGPQGGAVAPRNRRWSVFWFFCASRGALGDHEVAVLLRKNFALRCPWALPVSLSQTHSRPFHFVLVLNAECYSHCPRGLAKTGAFFHFKIRGGSCALDIPSPCSPTSSWASSDQQEPPPRGGWKGAGPPDGALEHPSQRAAGWVGGLLRKSSVRLGGLGGQEVSSGLGTLCQQSFAGRLRMKTGREASASARGRRRGGR